MAGAFQPQLCPVPVAVALQPPLRAASWLGIHWNDDPLHLGVWRNGRRGDLRSTALYDSAVLRAPWGEGVLEVNTGAARFQCRVDAEGRVEFD